MTLRYFRDWLRPGIGDQYRMSDRDSIAQSWSVLSRASDLERSRIAMDAVDKRLVRRDKMLVQLLAPHLINPR